MRHRQWMWLGVVGLVLALAGLTVRAEEECKAKVELPQAAAKAIKDAFPKATIEEVKAEDEDGVRLFEVEVEQDEAEIEVEVSPDGLIVSIESKVELKDVPDAAAKVISQAAQKAEIKKIQREEIRAEVIRDDKGNAQLVKLEEPKTVFEAELIKGDQRGKIEVAADGTVIEALKWKAKEPCPTKAKEPCPAPATK